LLCYVSVGLFVIFFAEDFFSSRSWKGLEQNLGQTEVCDAVEGRKGIASGYSNEQEGQILNK